MKVISQKELEDFQNEIKANEESTDLANRDANLEAIYSKMESNLTLLGATAVEDELQEEVEEVIS